jgi:hypothetical protein
MKQRRKRRTAGRVARKPYATPGRSPWPAADVRRQMNDIYRQLDDQLTRMAQIQLQFDRLLSKIQPL